MGGIPCTGGSPAATTSCSTSLCVLPALTRRQNTQTCIKGLFAAAPQGVGSPFFSLTQFLIVCRSLSHDEKSEQGTSRINSYNEEVEILLVRRLKKRKFINFFGTSVYTNSRRVFGRKIA